MANAAYYGVTRGALKRAAGTGDMAALFFASSAAAFITGQTLIVDGGRHFLLSVFERKPAPHLMRGGYRFALGKRVKTKSRSP